MAQDTNDPAGSIVRSVIRILDSFNCEGANYDSLIPILSLVCLVSILNRSMPQAAPASNASVTNPLQKLLGDLTKGEGGIGPESLMSLLPLLNNPQIKSKFNPSTMSAIFSLLNSMGDKSEKSEPKHEKHEKSEVNEKQYKSEQNAAAAQAIVKSAEQSAGEYDQNMPTDFEKKNLGRYLNWKNNF